MPRELRAFLQEAAMITRKPTADGLKRIQAFQASPNPRVSLAASMVLLIVAAGERVDLAALPVPRERD